MASTFTWSELKRKLRIIIFWLPTKTPAHKLTPKNIFVLCVCACQSHALSSALVMLLSRHWVAFFCRTHPLARSRSELRSLALCMRVFVCVLLARPENFSCALVSRQFFFSGSARFAFCCAGCYSAAAGKLHIHTHNWKTWLFIPTTIINFNFIAIILSRAFYTYVYNNNHRKKNIYNQIVRLHVCVCTYINIILMMCKAL